MRFIFYSTFLLSSAMMDFESIPTSWHFWNLKGCVYSKRLFTCRAVDLEYTNKICYAAGPESLDDYFQKGALLGQKEALNLWYVDPNYQKLFPSI